MERAGSYSNRCEAGAAASLVPRANQMILPRARLPRMGAAGVDSGDWPSARVCRCTTNNEGRSAGSSDAS